MASWDIFHAESLELERGLSTDAVRVAVAAGSLREDDLVRPAGTSAAWTRLGDLPELARPAAAVAPAAAAAGRAAAAVSATPVRSRDESARKDAAARDRVNAPRPEPVAARPPSSDLEVRALPAGQPELPELPVAAATATSSPPADWLAPDDARFPVISETPGPIDWDPESIKAPPRADVEEDSPPPADVTWAWPDDDDEDEEEGAAEFDEQIEILESDAGLEILDDDGLAVPSPYARESRGAGSVGLPVVPARDWNEDRAPVEVADEDDFTFARTGPMTVEELDLAPMVDVAFQLVLFFMVTATTVLYKTLEIPKPTNEQAPAAATQGRSRTMDDLQKDFILVEIDAEGAFKIDHEPVPATVDALAERLRTAREKTDRRVMLLSAQHATPHRNAVLAYDAANEIGMQIAIAKPAGPAGPAPSVFPAAGREGGAAASPAAGAPAAAPAAPAAPPRAAPPAAAPAAGALPF